MNDQVLCQQMQLIHMGIQNCSCLLIRLFYNAAYLIIDFSCHTVGIILGRAQIPSQKDFVLVIAVYHRPQLFTKAIACHHAARS